MRRGLYRNWAGWALVEGSKNFADIAGVKPSDIQIYCVAVDKILPMFSDKLGQYCLKYLDKWDVNYWLVNLSERLYQAVIYQNSRDDENDLLHLKPNDYLDDWS